MLSLQWPEEKINAIGGRSTRISGSQDVRAADGNLADLMEYGAWKSPAMPSRYAKKIAATDSAIAKLRKGLL